MVAGNPVPTWEDNGGKNETGHPASRSNDHALALFLYCRHFLMQRSAQGLPLSFHFTNIYILSSPEWKGVVIVMGLGKGLKLYSRGLQ